MKINHPNAVPLSDEQLLVLQSVKERLEAMVSSHGLTPEDVQELVREIKNHPLISTQLMAEIQAEVARLMPGQRFTFDWD
jgi:ribosomal protein S13